MKSRLWIWCMMVLCCMIYSCDQTGQTSDRKEVQTTQGSDVNVTGMEESSIQKISESFHVVTKDVPVKFYFEYLDSLLATIDTTTYGLLNEHVLILSNPRIIDTLMSYDYYLRMQNGQFVEDQKEVIVLHQGDSIRIPDRMMTGQILSMLRRVTIDVNIPEFRLRILDGDSVIHSCPVRVGKNKRKFLKLAGHEVNLQTPVGEGEIVRIEKNPLFMDPVDGKRYKGTWRDDGRFTKLPRIPFLEPTIAGIRRGSLIHPTTNRSTLGKAISNGCVGTSEADAWMIYYHAPLGTHVNFRYDTEVISELGDTIQLPDIYQLN